MCGYGSFSFELVTLPYLYSSFPLSSLPPPHTFLNTTHLSRYHAQHDALASHFLSQANPAGTEPVPSKSHIFSFRKIIQLSTLRTYFELLLLLTLIFQFFSRRCYMTGSHAVPTHFVLVI